MATPQAVDGVWTVTGFPVSNGADDFGFVTALIDVSFLPTPSFRAQ